MKEDDGCSQIILGCTELPIIIDDCLAKYKGVNHDDLVDSSDVMVEAVIKIAKGDLEINDALNYNSSAYHHPYDADPVEEDQANGQNSEAQVSAQAEVQPV